MAEQPVRQARHAAPAARTAEWPTLLVATAIYAAFAALTWFYHALPWWLLLPAGGYVVAWHGSLQHEAVHGHPSHRPWLNELLVFPSLWLWLPFRTYRDSHLAHHRVQHLTDPLEDPESYYITAERWRGSGPVMRSILWLRNTVTGRLLLGPLLVVWDVVRAEFPRLLRGERDAVTAWALHLPACALVLYWTVAVCDIPVLAYFLFFAYPGISLTLLRSFAEHQADRNPQHRSVVVEASWPMALLYLNNNLHALHHREPGLAWYALPARYRDQRDAILTENGGYRFHGYAALIARYLLWPKESLVHPAFSGDPIP